MAVTPARPRSVAECGVGLDDTFQVRPFQRTISLRSMFFALRESPTAKALARDTAATAVSSSPLPRPGCGVGTRLHVLPFQCNAIVKAACGKLLTAKPTAQAFDPDVADTPARRLSCCGPAGLGLFTRRHLE